MANISRIRLMVIFFLIFLTTRYSYSMSLTSAHKKLSNDLKSGRGLYNSDEKINVLNVTNFKSKVYGTKNAWIVEFYNSWCGFCHRFAPLWRALASDVYAWRDVIAVGAVDCANDDNNQMCREYEIMHYPMLKFFPANSLPSSMGLEVVKGKTLQELRHALVDILEKEHVDGKGILWPNITPYRSGDINNFWKYIPETILYTIMIFEEQDSYIGTEVILDLHSVEKVHIRSILNHNEAVSKLMSVSTFPSVVVLERNMKITPLQIVDHTRESVRATIKEFLKSQNIKVPPEEIIAEPENFANAHVPDLVELMAESELEKKHEKIKSVGNVVFRLDLEMALQYSLRHEIPSHKLITGRKLDALKDYLRVLSKYFPVKHNGVTFLDQIRDRVVVANSLDGQQMLEYVQELNGHDIDKDVDWLGCLGSKSTSRGYPCGLWTLFHTLTVNAALKSHQADNPTVLEAMLGYIKYFFGCQDCTKHFQEMALTRSLSLSATNPDKSVLWLWEAHNIVNKRLAKDETEDPLYPKQQYPSKEVCPQCRSADGAWDYNVVLKHLKKVYGPDNINRIGLDLRIENEPATENTLEAHFVLDSNVEIKKLGWNFNNFDISICVMLYFFSVLILAVVCYKFVMRRKYKKKQYAHDLFGKV